MISKSIFENILKLEIKDIKKIVNITNKDIFDVNTDKGNFIIKDYYYFDEFKQTYFREKLARQFCTQLQIPCSKILFQNEKITIEEKIEGFLLQEIYDENNLIFQENLYIKIGQNLKKLHTIKTKKIGFIIDENLNGCYNNYEEFIDLLLKKDLNELNYKKNFPNDTIEKFKEFYKENKQILNKNNNEECKLIHGDLHNSNIIISLNQENVYFFDFEDLSSGYPAQDLSTLLLEFGENSKEFKAIIKGYNSNELKMEEIKFFAALRSINWILDCINHNISFDKIYENLLSCIKK